VLGLSAHTKDTAVISDEEVVPKQVDSDPSGAHRHVRS
jgi:hypothetical protein